jgi:multiple sugar transport system permease protein
LSGPDTLLVSKDEGGRGIVELKRSKTGHKGIYGLLFVLPFMAGLAFFRLYPFIKTFCTSLTSTNMITFNSSFVGLANYQRLLNDATFYSSIKVTVTIWALNIVPRLGLALLCAAVFAQGKMKGKQLFKIVYYFPNLVNAATVAVLASLLFNWQTGTVNRVLFSLGVISQPINWLGVPDTAQGVVAGIIWWMWFGYSAVMFTTGILSVPGEINEAGVIDGANAWQRFWHITFPMIRPTFAYVFLTTLVGGLQNFEIPRVITDGIGSPNKALLTMALQMYILAFRSMQQGYASAYAMGIFLFTAVVAALSYRFLNKKTF